MHGNAFTIPLAVQDFLSIGYDISSSCQLDQYISFTYYMRADAEGLAQIHWLSEVGKLKSPVEKTFPITQVRKAHEAKDKRLILGKVLPELDSI
ncbi:hypothetical protein ACSBR1_039860 [Camellia fascicularis]